jgi:hypothetical protein
LSSTYDSSSYSLKSKPASLAAVSTRIAHANRFPKPLKSRLSEKIVTRPLGFEPRPSGDITRKTLFFFFGVLNEP